MTINLDALTYNLIEFDDAVAREDKKGVDEKMQQITKQLAGFNPSLVIAVNAAYKQMSEPSKLQLEGLEEKILGIISKNFPKINIKAKIQQHHELEIAFNKAVSDGNTEELEKLLKQGVDLNRNPPFLKGKSLISAALESKINVKQKYKLIEFLLKNGANIPAQNRDTFIQALFLEFEEITPEFLELLCARGFEIQKDGETATAKATSWDNIKLLIYFGLQPDPPKVWDTTDLDIWCWVSIREEALDELNKQNSQQLTLKELTAPQRRALAERCRDIVRFDDAHFRFGWDWEDNSALEPSIKATKAFVRALEANDLDQAGKILKESGPLRLNSRIVYSKLGSGKIAGNITVLCEACLQGNLKQVEWLLKAGANPKVGHDFIPPIIATAFSKSPEKIAIMKLLKDAGGDVNMSLGSLPWVHNYFFVSAMNENGSDKDFNPADIIKTLLQFGLKFDLGPIAPLVGISNKTNQLKFLEALVFYGYDVPEKAFEKMPKDDLQAIRKAIELRDKLLLSMETGILMEDPSLKVFSKDLVGMVAEHQPLIHTLLSEQRLQLAEQCYAAKNKDVG